jgi:hypothetical protein
MIGALASPVVPSNANPYADNSDPASQPQPLPGQPAPQSAAPPGPQAGAPPIDPSAGGGIADMLRAYLHNQINNGGLQDNTSFLAPVLAKEMSVLHALKPTASALPGPGPELLSNLIDYVDTPQGLTDTFNTAVDVGLDRAKRAQVGNDIYNGTQQGLAGFNEGLGNVILAPADALDSATGYIAGKIANVIGASPPPTLPGLHDYYNQAFVAPAGDPQTPMQKRIRGSARLFGADMPTFLVGGGIGASGIRSGVTLAEQEAPGLLDSINVPAKNETLVGRLGDIIRNRLPNLNSMLPTNVVNAFRTPNLQGAADNAVNQVAAHPYVSAYADLTRDWRKERQRKPLQAVKAATLQAESAVLDRLQQQQQPDASAP